MIDKSGCFVIECRRAPATMQPGDSCGRSRQPIKVRLSVPRLLSNENSHPPEIPLYRSLQHQMDIGFQDSSLHPSKFGFHLSSKHYYSSARWQSPPQPRKAHLLPPTAWHHRLQFIARTKVEIPSLKLPSKSQTSTTHQQRPPKNQNPTSKTTQKFPNFPS